MTEAERLAHDLTSAARDLHYARPVTKETDPGLPDFPDPDVLRAMDAYTSALASAVEDPEVVAVLVRVAVEAVFQLARYSMHTNDARNVLGALCFFDEQRRLDLEVEAEPVDEPPMRASESEQEK
jgi:hypothetical protein